MAFEREVWQAFITNNSGDVQPNAQITVFDAGTSNLSTIYSGLTGAPRPNPFNTGSDGLAKFYAEPARYRVQAQSSAGIAVFDDVDLSQKALREDLADPESDVLIAGFPARSFNDKINELQSDFDGFIDDSQQDVNQFINDNQTAINRLEAEKKLKRNAVVYLDFANNEGKEADDFTVVRDDATNLIDYTAPDGVSVQTADGRIVFAPANTAAIGWNDGRAVGLVTAPASTNLLLWSEDFSNSVWQVSGGTKTPLNDDSLGFELVEYREAENTSRHALYQVPSVTLSEGVIYSEAVYIEAVEMADRFCVIMIGSTLFGTTRVGVVVDATAGEITNSFSAGEASSVSADIRPLGRGWVVEVSFIPTSSITSPFVQVGLTTNPNTSAAGNHEGDTSKSLLIGRPQFEAGYPTPYIRTEDSQVTRGTIDARKQIAVNPNQWSFLCEFYFKPHENRQMPFKLYEATDGVTADTVLNEAVTAEIRNNSDFRVVTRDSNGTNTSSVNALNTEGEINKVVYTYRDGVMKAFLNGSLILTRNLASIPISAVRLGSGARVQGNAVDYTTHSNCPITSFKMTNDLVTDAEAIALTTLED